MADFSVKHITPKLGGEREARNPNGPTSEYDLVEQMVFLYVKVIEARYLSELKPLSRPIVDITLGNYKATTKDLPTGEIREKMDWKQVFAFDKSKGDVLSVTLKADNTEIGKQNFKLSADIPTRISPEPEIASTHYTMFNAETGIRMDLLMSVWFGTQADEAYSQAWFSDSFEVSASCVINTRSQTYFAPRLCYVRITVVSGRDLIARDRSRTPSVYVKVVVLGTQFALRTEVKTGSDPSWNQDLIFVASERLDETVEISLIDRIDDEHEECIGKLKPIKVSAMTPLKQPGSASATPHPIEPCKVEPAGDRSRFTSEIYLKLATDQVYHVFDECIQYSSDYRPFVKTLWPSVLGKLEIGILGATGLKLPRADDPKKGIDSYVVVKYGNKWDRTRTVVNNSSPKWNEQFGFDIYEKSTVLTLGVYDNRNLVYHNHPKDVPIGKVRIPLSSLQWDRLYTSSVPILVLSRSGLKKLGEIKIAMRCVPAAPNTFAFYSAPYRWMLPKAHYKSPLSPEQIERLRAMAVEVNCMNLAKTEPPLRNEVVMDILKPKYQSFSMRITKAHYERVLRIGLMLSRPFIWFDAKVISTTDFRPKLLTVGLVPIVVFYMEWILWIPFLIPFGGYYIIAVIWLCYKYWKREYAATRPLILFDLKMSKLDSVMYDELAEEFDTFPSSEMDVNVLRMRYDRFRKLSANVMKFLGDLACQGERLYALLVCDDPLLSGGFYISCLGLFAILVFCPYSVRCLVVLSSGYLVNFPCCRNDLPCSIRNFFRRLPTNEDLML